MPGPTDLTPTQRPRLTRQWSADVSDHVIALLWSPCGQTIAAASVSGPVTLFTLNGDVAHTLAGHGFGTTAVSWRHDGALLATAGQDGLVRVWDAASGVERFACQAGAAWVEHVLWHPSRNLLASAAGKKLRLWSDGQLLRELPDHAATITDLSWRPNTGDLTSATYRGVALWSVETNDLVQWLEWNGSILKLAWSPDGSRLAHGNQDATVRFLALADGSSLEMEGYATKVRELCWDATGKYLATGGGEVVTTWVCEPAVAEDATPLYFEGHLGPITALAFQTRGPLLASGGVDGVVMLWQPGASAQPLGSVEVDSAVTRLAWSPDDRSLVVGTEAGGVLLYVVEQAER